jgi:pyruvate/2-oxoglutarate dehydrogenase complex dihydrolipoamide acyltransferase (E2) component
VARIEVVAPTYGMADGNSYIQSWLVEAGTQVAAGDPLVLIETAKAETELEAPSAGTVGELLVAADTEVAPGTALTWIESESHDDL